MPIDITDLRKRISEANAQKNKVQDTSASGVSFDELRERQRALAKERHATEEQKMFEDAEERLKAQQGFAALDKQLASMGGTGVTDYYNTPQGQQNVYDALTSAFGKSRASYDKRAEEEAAKDPYQRLQDNGLTYLDATSTLGPSTEVAQAEARGWIDDAVQKMNTDIRKSIEYIKPEDIMQSINLTEGFGELPNAVPAAKPLELLMEGVEGAVKDIARDEAAADAKRKAIEDPEKYEYYNTFRTDADAFVKKVVEDISANLDNGDGYVTIGEKLYPTDVVKAMLPAVVYQQYHPELMEKNAAYRDKVFMENTGKTYKEYMKSHVDELKEEIRTLRNEAGEKAASRTAGSTSMGSGGGTARIYVDRTAYARGVAEEPYNDVLEKIEAWEDNDFASGFSESFDILDFATLGVGPILQGYSEKQIYDKVNNGETLSKSEASLLRLRQIEAEIEGLRDVVFEAPSIWSKIGSGLGSTVAAAPEFALAMPLTGGIGAAVKYRAKGALKSFIANKTLKNAAKLAGTATLDLAKYSGVNYARGMAAAPIMPSFYNGVLTEYNSQYSFDEDGNLKYSPKSDASMWLAGYVDAVNEVTSEHFGVGFGKVIGLGAKAFGKGLGIDNFFNKSVTGATTRRAAQAPLTQTAKKTLKNVGFSGAGDPVGEVFGDLMSQWQRRMVGADYSFEHFHDFDYWLTTLGVSALYGGALTLTVGAVNIEREAKMVKDIAGERKRILDTKIQNPELRDKLRVLADADNTVVAAAELSKFFRENPKLEDTDKGYALDFMKLNSTLKVVMGDVEEQERMQKFEAHRKEIEGRAYIGVDGQPTNTIMQATDKNGNTYFVHRGDVSNKDEMIEVIDANTGAKSAIIASELTVDASTTVDSVLLDSYDQLFSVEDEVQRIKTAQETLASLENITIDDIETAAQNLDIALPKKGDVVTMVDGREVEVIEDMGDGTYIGQRKGIFGEAEVISFPFDGIRSNDSVTAEAQKVILEESLAAATIAEAATPTTAATPASQPTGINVGAVALMPNNEQVRIVEINNDGTAVVDHNVDGSGRAEDMELEVVKLAELHTPEAAPVTPMAEETPQADIPAAPQVEATTATMPQTSAEAAQEVQEASQAVDAAESVEQVPTMKDGTIDYDAIEDPRKCAQLMAKNFGGPENALAMVEESIEAVEAEMEKVAKTKAPTINDSVAKQTKIAELKARLIRYEAIAFELEQMMKPEEVKTDDKAEEVKHEAGLVENEHTAGLPEAMRKSIDEMAKRAKVRIEFVNERIKGDAEQKGNLIRVSTRNRTKAVEVLVGHELLHYMKSKMPEAYKAFKEAVIAFIGKDKFVKEVARRKKAYAAQNVKLNDEAAAEEIVADYAGFLVQGRDIFEKFIEPKKSDNVFLRGLKKGLEYIRNIFGANGMTKQVKAVDNMVDALNTLINATVEGKDIEKREEATAETTKNEEAKGEDGETKTKHSLKAQPSLVGVHNISLDKLRKVIKMGGLANPSVAVIDVDKQTHDDYGEYSLVLPKNMVDARKGKNAGTWAGDAWTPTYPQIVKRMNDDKAISRFYKDIDALPDAMRNRVRLDFDSFMEGRSANALAYWYLFEKGDAPELVYVPSRYSDDITNAIEEATNGSFSMYRLTPEERAKCLDAYIAVKFNGDRSAFEEEMQARIERLAETIETKKSDRVKKWAQDTIDSIKEYGFDYDDVADFIRDVEYDGKEKGKVNVDATIMAAQERINESNLAAEYDAWRNNLDVRYGIKEYIFNGYTNNGDRKYLPHTVENASKWMKKQGREGAVATFPSFGTFVAVSIPKMTTLESIRKRKALLGKSKEEYDAFREKWENVYYELGKKLQPDAKSFEDYGYWRLIEAVGKNNPKEFIKKEYGIELSEEDMAKFNNMVNAIRTEYPARYFETKFERPLQLGDFVAAVVPNDMPMDVYGRLNDANIEIFEYEKGDNNSRAEAMQRASEVENVRFSLSAAPTFYSNAQYAVQNIKQEKATPEQWLKMIEKNGGLKAGEDKWLGLSDWLKASDKKTLTKDEVLQYIAENDIQIEEVTYGEPEYISENEIYESDAFSNLVASLTDYDEDDNPYINKEQYKELQNADPDFLDGFSLDYWGEGLDIDDKMAAARYLGLLGVDNEINGTRLQYTTQGLTKKREIALVVPTIEPYNQSDDIHFGDAGEGRAVAWVRFGDAEAQRSEKVVRRVDEFETPYKDVNGHEIYRSKDRLYAKDFISYGKLKSGEYAYVVYVNDKQIPVAHKSLEDARNALNEHYKANPEKRTRWDKVLVIDEIQSKRHQEGREKGYSNRSVSQQELYEAQEAAFSKVIDYESALADKYGEDEWAALATAEEMAEYERLRALDEAATNAYENYDKGVPSAPFEKNWAELAFKRMLRYAAENGYDYVAWTTGDQQADRYDIGSVVKDIVTYDTKDADGNPIKKMKFRMNNMGTYNIATSMEGVIVKGDGEMKEGMHLSDITGKPLAEKIMKGEGEDAMVFENGKDIEAKSLEGEELHIGNEGMKAFYDQMLPSFVKKYTKKWGAEVGEVTMPALEENNTMHAVNVTDSMRESVMQGQPKFSLITPEMDASYLDAVERGDMTTAQKMVMEAAKLAMPNTKVVDENGNPKVVYHGTPNYFNAFSKEMFGTSTDRGIWGNGFYFSEDGGYAKQYQKRNGADGRTLSLFLSLKNPLFISLKDGGNEGAMYFHRLNEKYFTDDIFEDAAKVDENMKKAQQQLSDNLIADGYDGVVIEYSHPTIAQEYVAFEPNQIKSADPVTYDDNGNIIPLSERFNPEKEDIRYSLPTDLLTDFAEEFNSLQKEYESLAPSTIDYKHPFRVRKREVVQRYADHITEVLGLPCEVFVIDATDAGQVKDAYDRYKQSHQLLSQKNPKRATKLASFDKFESWLKNDDGEYAFGMYFHGTDFIVMNISDGDTYNEQNGYLQVCLHENVHGVMDALRITDFEKKAVLAEGMKHQPKVVINTLKGYEKEDDATKGEELIAFAINTRLNRKFGNLLLDYFEGNASEGDIWKSYNLQLPLRLSLTRKILNYLKDGYERKQNSGNASGDTGGNTATNRQKAKRFRSGYFEENPRNGQRGSGAVASLYSSPEAAETPAIRYSLSDIPFFDAEGNAIDMSAISEAKALEMVDSRVRTMLEDDYNKRVIAIAKEAKDARRATRAYYAEERRKRRGANAVPRTNYAKLQELFADTDISSLPLEVQALIRIASGDAKIYWADRDGKKGLASELGLKDSATDKKAMQSIWSGATQSFDEVVHNWWESINGYERGIDTQDLRNALIDALLSFPNSRDAMRELQSRYDAIANAEREALEEIDRREGAELDTAKTEYMERQARFELSEGEEREALRAMAVEHYSSQPMSAAEEALEAITAELNRVERRLEVTRKNSQNQYAAFAEALGKGKEVILRTLEGLRMFSGMDSITLEEVAKLIAMVRTARSKAQLDAVATKAKNLVQRIAIKKARENMRRLLELKLSNVDVIQQILKESNTLPREERDALLKSLWKVSRNGWRATRAVHPDTKEVFKMLNNLVRKYKKKVKVTKGHYSIDAALAEVEKKLHPGVVIDKQTGKVVDNSALPTDYDNSIQQTALFLFKTYLEVEAKNDAYRAAAKKLRETAKDSENFGAALAEMYDARDAYLAALKDYNATLEGVIVNGKDDVHDFNIRKEKHATEIRQMGIEAIGGAPASSQGKAVKGLMKIRAGLNTTVNAPFWTFEMVLERIDHLTPYKQGRFYEYFMRKFSDANNALFINYSAHMSSIGEAMAKCFPSFAKSFGIIGRNPFEMYKAVMRKAQATAIGTLEYVEKGRRRTMILNVANAMYIIAMWRQPRYRAAMEANAISQEKIDAMMAKIKEANEGYIPFMNWVNDTFLPGTRLEYDVVHRNINGGSMAKEENYFPAKVAAHQEVKLDDQGKGKLPTSPSAIKERVSHGLMPQMGMDYFRVLEAHIQDMDKWSAFAELTEDLNILLSSDEFRRRLNEYMPGLAGDGSGAGSLYKMLYDTALIATGNYRSSSEQIIGGVQKAWATSNIAFRLWTAVKQISSVSVGITEHYYFGKHLLKTATMVGIHHEWKRAMEISPSLRNRWQSKAAGMEALMRETSQRGGYTTHRGTYEKVHDVLADLGKKAVEVGMTPNAAVDAVACAILINSVYDKAIYDITKGKREATEEEKKIAVRKAEIAFNSTQQSSEGAYLSAAQANPLYAPLTTYMNASFALHRKRMSGIRELWRIYTSKEYRAFLKEEFGVDAYNISRNDAIKDIIRGIVGDLAFSAMGWGLMNLASWITELFGGDADDDDDIAAERRSFFNTFWMPALNGYLGGGIVASALQGYDTSITPAYDELIKDIQGVFDDKGTWWYEAVEVCAKYGVGIDLKSIKNVAAGIENMWEDDGEKIPAVLKLINAPERYVKAFAGDRRDGETIEEYMTRILQLQSLFVSIKYEDFVDENGKYIGDDTPLMLMSKTEANKFLKEYDDKRIENILREYGDSSVFHRWENIDSDYREILKDMHWGYGTKPSGYPAHSKQGVILVDLDKWKSTIYAQASAANVISQRQKFLGEEETIFELLIKEMELKEQVINSYYGPANK